VRTFAFHPFVIVVGLAATMLSGCSGWQPPIGTPGAMGATHPLFDSGYEVLYEFQGDGNGKTDGAFPHSSLIAVKNRLYGTTVQGGNNNYSACGGGEFFAGCGTVFEVTPSGKERVLYGFAGGEDGFYPEAGLLWLNGMLYGTTSAGGSSHCDQTYGKLCGTVFALTLSGRERVLHRFAGSPDGVGPAANLIAVNGKLYGTTAGGGYLGKGNGCYYDGCGVVFEISTSGSERVLHAFKGGKDGATPSGPLLSVSGTLFGTTTYGGSSTGGGCGTVFKVSTSGSESVVYRFNAVSGGCYPIGGLVKVKGALYGVAASGGRCADCGAVFKTTTKGRAQLIYRFEGGTDGGQLLAGLLALRGVLYGTTASGGAGCSASLGCGTVFKMTTSGVEEVLYAFEGGGDGGDPQAGLAAFRDMLYGTTVGGGDYYCGISSSGGCGTVFKILP
jgi:uncharacterized repeat protein (TIGR03803 family)